MIEKLNHLILGVTILMGIKGLTQPIHDSDLFHNRQARFLSLLSQNDIYQFNPSDKYFTNGLHVGFADESLHQNWTQFLLANPLKKSSSTYVLKFGQDVFTPLNIWVSSVDSSDIPYSGALYFTFTRQANNPQIGLRWQSNLFFGVQGPMAGAGNLQYWYHEISNNPLPKGWHNQIGNGLILDYEIEVERLLPLTNEFVEWNVNANLRLGSYLNYATIGTLGKIGVFNYSYASYNGLKNTHSKSGRYKTNNLNWLKKTKRSDKTRQTNVNGLWQFYAVAGANLQTMFYDGRVQGSLIPFMSSPYLWRTSNYNHFNAQLLLGARLSYKNVMLQFTHYEQTDVYKGSGSFGWADIKLVVSF
jgi:hypothetical protein